MTKSKHTVQFDDEQMFSLKQKMKAMGKKPTVQTVIDYSLQLTTNAHSILDEETLKILQ